jgi:hypothetical protein
MKRFLLVGLITLFPILLGIKSQDSANIIGSIQSVPNPGLDSQHIHNQYAKIVRAATLDSDPDLEPGFPVQTLHLPGTYFGWASINTRVGNIDSDPQLEILVSGVAQGPLYAWNHDGTLEPGWPVYYYNNTFYTSLGNLSNQPPGLEVFTGQFIVQVPEAPPHPLMAYSGNGEFLLGWPKYKYFSPYPTLADLNSDGLDEIVVNNYVYKADGTTLSSWSTSAQYTDHDAIADLDGDGDLEIIATINAIQGNGVDLVAYHHDGSRVEGINVRIQPYRHQLPVIGDVDGDGSPEIMIFSYGDWPPPSSSLALLIISNTGVIKHTIPFNLMSHSAYMEASSAPALADLDQDNIPEIVIGLNEAVIVFRGDGTVFPGWPVTWSTTSLQSVGNGAPVVGDIDGDQFPDIVSISINDYLYYPQDIFAFDRHGNLIPGFPKHANIGQGAVPAIADIDLDGRNELIITGTYWGGISGIYDKVWVYDLRRGNTGKVEWGQLGGGPQNWGSYPPPPIYPGSDLFISAPESIYTPPTVSSFVPLEYGNQGVALAFSVVLTATLEPGLTYIHDTSGITPTVNGQTVSWVLPNLGYLIHSDFLLNIGLPPGATYGDSYNLRFEINSEQADAVPSDNTGLVNVKVVRQVFLPLTRK